MIKRVLTITLCAAVCLALAGAARPDLFQDAMAETAGSTSGSPAAISALSTILQKQGSEGSSTAVQETVLNLSDSDFSLGSGRNGWVSFENGGMEIAPDSESAGEEHVNFLATSRKTVDFTRSFRFSGMIRCTSRPDGLAIVFQPDGNYQYTDYNSGSSLGIYNVDHAPQYVKNGLALEYDTYQSDWLAIDTDPKIKALAGDGGSTVPHAALTVLGSDGSGDIISAAKAGTGSLSCTITWDASSRLFKADIGSAHVEYRDMDPKAVFGTDHPYMTLSGSVNFGRDFGSDDQSWGVSADSFHYIGVQEDPGNNDKPGNHFSSLEEQESQLAVTEVSSQNTEYAQAGKRYKQTLKVTNNGTDTVEGVWVRRYMPKYTNFYEVEEGGSYGFVNGKEHVTWFIPKLKPGESRTLTYTLEVNQCKPDQLKLDKEIKYQLLGTTEEPYANEAEDPERTAEQ